MEKIGLLIILCFPCLLMGQRKTEFFAGGSRCESGEWKIIFQDDFNGDKLDVDKWYSYFPYGPNNSDDCQFCRTHDTSWSRQIFKDDNVIVKDGFAHLLSREETSSWQGVSSSYSSAVLYSKEVFKNYAKFEIRCKIPHGQYVLPAFWVFGWSTEIDAFELTNEGLSDIMMTVHRWSDGVSNGSSGFLKYFNFWDDFHVYSIIYEKNFVRFYIDGIERHKMSRYLKNNNREITRCRIKKGEYIINSIFPVYGNPVQLIASSNVASYRNPESKNGQIIGDFIIDYIRVYQRN